MKFMIIFEIYPPSQFGIPEDAKTVIPVGSGSLMGDTFYSPTMTRVGYGSLSRYREEKQAITLKASLGDILVSIKDNFATLTVEASGPGEAYDMSTAVIDRFLQHLSLSTEQLFYYRAVVIEGEEGKIYPVPRAVIMASVTMYDLDRLRTEIENATISYKLRDSVLDRALNYYEHALYLYEKRSEIEETLSRHFNYLIAAAFLNMWKALSTIIGDPSVDKDYQSRYKRLGFDYGFFTSQIEYVRNIRNQYDVAHYHLEEDRIKEAESNFGKAKGVVVKVIKSYVQHLGEGNESFTNI